MVLPISRKAINGRKIMQAQTNITKINVVVSAIAAAVLLTTLVSAPAGAESWELRTAAEEVKGTRAIEAGRLDKGIRILEANYGTTPYLLKGAVLTNLCLAYTLKRDFETAMDYCNRAVARGNNDREAHNNRGVLQALLGNYSAAAADFEEAGCLGECPNTLAVAGNQRMDVAKRNLDRAQFQLAQQAEQNREIQVVERGDP